MEDESSDDEEYRYKIGVSKLKDFVGAVVQAHFDSRGSMSLRIVHNGKQ